MLVNRCLGPCNPVALSGGTGSGVGPAPGWLGYFFPPWQPGGGPSEIQQTLVQSRAWPGAGFGPSGGYLPSGGAAGGAADPVPPAAAYQPVSGATGPGSSSRRGVSDSSLRQPGAGKTQCRGPTETGEQRQGRNAPGPRRRTPSGGERKSQASGKRKRAAVDDGSGKCPTVQPFDITKLSNKWDYRVDEVEAYLWNEYEKELTKTSKKRRSNAHDVVHDSCFLSYFTIVSKALALYTFLIHFFAGFIALQKLSHMPTPFDQRTCPGPIYVLCRKAKGLGKLRWRSR